MSLRIVHASDLHLGFRQYARTTSRGINQREVDVAQAFSRVIDKTIALAPELVVIGGDLYHSIKPSPMAVIHATNEFARLRAALPHVEVIGVAGNHDSPRVSDTGTFLPLFRQSGVRIIDGAPTVIDLPHLDCSVLGVADNKFPRPELAPTGSRKYNVMVLHGETGGISPAGTEAAKRELSDGELHVNAWDYIALGHYHVVRECWPNCFYSGAIEYTSSNIWGERAEEIEKGIPGKGIIERDLDTGVTTFHPLPTRRVIDLPSFSAALMSPKEIDAAIAEIVEASDIEDAVVRLVVNDCTTPMRRMLDHKAIRAHERRAVAFTLDCKKPEAKAAGGPRSGSSRKPAAVVVAEALAIRPLASDLDRDELLALNEHFMAEAELADTMAVTPDIQVAA